MTQKKDTILHFIDSLDQGGAETLLLSYIPLLTAYNHVVVVLREKRTDVHSGFTYLNLDLDPKRNFIAAIYQIRKIIKQYNISTVHSHSYWTNILSRIGTPNSVQLINHYHFADYTNTDKPAVRKMITLDKLLSFRKITRIAVSNYVGEILSKTFKGGSIKTIPNFIVHTIQSQNRRGSTPTMIRAVAVGNCKWEKNYPILLEAFLLLKEAPITIDIYGGGEKLTHFQDEAKRMGLTKVSFKGPCLSLGTLLPDYDLFLSTSVMETFGMVLLEAMAAGLPIIASNIPAFSEVLDGSATLFDPLDATALQQKLSAFIANPQPPDVGQYAAILKKYSKETFVKDLLEVYENSQS